MCGTYSDPDLIQQFVLEARDLLQSIEQDLIALELSPEDDEILNRMFRALHTIKGTSAFLGIEPAARLSHCAEDVLSGLRGREVQFTRRTTNLLLAARDQLGQMVDDLDRGATPIFATDNLLTELERCSQPKISDTPTRDDLERQTPPVSSVVPPDVQGSLMDSAPLWPSLPRASVRLHKNYSPPHCAPEWFRFITFSPRFRGWCATFPCRSRKKWNYQ